MARLMFSAGMFAALASATMVRSRGFVSGSPPPARAATVISLMIRVKMRPRLASAAPVLCLSEFHCECRDMRKLEGKFEEKRGGILPYGLAGQQVSTPGLGTMERTRRAPLPAAPKPGPRVRQHS